MTGVQIIFVRQVLLIGFLWTLNAGGWCGFDTYMMQRETQFTISAEHKGRQQHIQFDFAEAAHAK